MTHTTRLLGAMMALGACAQAQATDFPRNPVTLTVPYAAGGNLDVTTRTIAPFLGEALGTSIVVMNRPGAGGSVGATQISRARPDGYNLLTTATTELSVTPHITDAPYSMDSFALVGTINTVPMMIEVTPNSQYKTIKQLMDTACAQPDTVTMGIAGIGSVNYMALRLLQEATGCQFKMVPYNGSGPALLGVLGGQIDAIIDQVSSSKPYLDSGKLVPLVVMSEDKIAGFESVPSLRAAGITGADMATVAALVAPAGVPQEVLDKLRAALKTTMKRPDVQAKLAALGGVAYTAENDNFMEVIKPLDTLARKYKAEGSLSTQ